MRKCGWIITKVTGKGRSVFAGKGIPLVYDGVSLTPLSKMV